MLEGLSPVTRQYGPCGLIRKAQDELSESDQKILLEALDNKLFSNNGLAEQLTQRGFSISENTVRKHRIGKCACAREPK